MVSRPAVTFHVEHPRRSDTLRPGQVQTGRRRVRPEPAARPLAPSAPRTSPPLTAHPPRGVRFFPGDDICNALSVQVPWRLHLRSAVFHLHTSSVAPRSSRLDLPISPHTPREAHRSPVRHATDRYLTQEPVQTNATTANLLMCPERAREASGRDATHVTKAGQSPVRSSGPSCTGQAPRSSGYNYAHGAITSSAGNGRGRTRRDEETRRTRGPSGKPLSSRAPLPMSRMHPRRARGRHGRACDNHEKSPPKPRFRRSKGFTKWSLGESNP